MKSPKALRKLPNPLGDLSQKLLEVVQQLSGKEPQSFLEIGSQVSVVLQEAGRLALEQRLQQEALSQPTQLKCNCGKIAFSQGFESIEIISRLGICTLSRRRMKCQECQRSWLPFDEQWQLPSGKYAADIREATERLAIRIGFREAVDELEHFWGIHLDPSTAQRWVQQDGQRAEDKAQQDSEQHWKAYEEEVQAIAQGDQKKAKRTRIRRD